MKKIAALFVATAALGATVDASAGLRDENLASTVHVELLTADTVDGTLISVRADDGAIVLDGVVGTEQAKSAAEQIAEDIEGVTSVRNQLTVDPALAAQAQVAQDLARPDAPPGAGSAAPGTRAQDTARATGGTAGASSGGIDTMAANAGTGTSDCIGARYRSRLLGQPLAQANVKVADEELRQRVTKALDNDPLLESSDIRVTSAHDGTVKLEGRAQAIPVHRHALLTAFHVPGVCRVASDITSPADAAAAAVAPDPENAEAAASAQGAGDEPTAPNAVVPVPVPAPVPHGDSDGTPVD